ncbi:mechanosensitive ion channel family protein [Algibacillus agarilyticus]|uniref:mechanosensitive ion channel family protein n=1 Tax=Algibacillus agarilyticus TaxID=2234133 RepID=UPI000DD07552|nr:mechanosensitive ion channel family protein [Algibacillus agarilyticus]
MANDVKSADITNVLAPTNLLHDEISQINKLYEIIIEFFANYSFQLIGAIIIFFIGYALSNKVGRFVLALCLRQKLDVTLSHFLSNTAKMVLVGLVIVISLGKLGISITPIIAAIGAVSLGAGLALQGLLANYAAGFNIILIRPFVVGDTITVQGVTGVVKEVLLAYTILQDEDNVDITIPNKHIVGEVLHNSKNDSLLELSVGIAYRHNPLDVVKLIEKSINDLGIASEKRTPQIGIGEFADSSINIEIRLWTPTENLFASKYQAYEAIYLTLKEANISIPFPQREVHLIKQ